MASPRLKVGGAEGFDFSPYLRTQPDESPAADAAGAAYFRPQFSGAPALGDGSSWVGDAVDNRTMTFPLYFTGESRAAIQKLIREADLALVKGAQVEFAVDPDVDSPSYFDLERGVCAEEFNFYHLINALAGAVLTLTVRPYANTATHRLIASIPAATSAVVKFAATGIMGDAYALANLEVRVGSAVASAGRVIAWGVHPHPSHNPYRAATSGLAQTGATVRGASGAIGSQYTAIPVSPTGASGIAYTAYLDPPSAHVGRHRVIAIGRSALTVPIPLWAEDRFGAVLGATALASQTDVNKWQVIDLGEVQVPARASGQDTVPTQFVNIYGGGANGALINASPAFHLNGLMFLPLDFSAGILRTAGARGLSPIRDTFSRLYFKLLLEEAPISETGQVWAKVGGYLGQEGGEAFPARHHSAQLNVVTASSTFTTAASGFYSVASGVLYSDVFSEVGVKLNAAIGNSPSVVAASSNAVTNYVKYSSAGWVAAKLGLGPSPYLALISSTDGVATSLNASAGMPSMLASGLLEGQQHKIVTRIQGARADVWIATGVLGASPVLSASNSAFTQVGWPGLEMNAAAQNASKGYISVPNFYYGSLSSGSAVDIGAREWFRFESHPEPRVYQGNASVFVQDRLANYRGQFPHMPPVASNSTATAAARVVVFQSEVDNVQGLDGPDISLAVLERFRFLAGG
jgi:hypothetical protein